MCQQEGVPLSLPELFLCGWLREADGPKRQDLTALGLAEARTTRQSKAGSHSLALGTSQFVRLPGHGGVPWHFRAHPRPSPDWFGCSPAAEGPRHLKRRRCCKAKRPAAKKQRRR